ncbi:MAG: hypothetical protein ABI612_05425 [Betaproteobacteria bacterium]
MKIDRTVRAVAGIELIEREAAQVSGGIEKENLYPHKPGGVEVGYYLDGIYMGTATVNRNDPTGPFNPPVPCNT